MAIINMADSREEAEQRAAEAVNGGNVRKLNDKPEDGERYENRIWLYDSFIGLCISDREMNGYDDSDWYMLVWNPRTSKYEEHWFATTRGWSYPCYSSKPDATPEVLAAYEAYQAELARKAQERRDLEHLMTPAPGKRLEVIKGRKVPVGTTGECIWVGQAKEFNPYAGTYARRYGYSLPVKLRVGLKTADGEVHWTSADNVQVI